MITSGSSSLELKFEVFIHDALVDYTAIQRVSVDLSENQHNLVIMDIAGIPSQYLTSYTDLPVSVKVTVGTVWSYEFIGYIAYLETVSKNKDGLVNKSPFQLTRMHCLGATYIMKAKRNYAYENITLPSLATQLADKYSMSVSVPKDPYVFPRITQSEKSDWAVLVDSANYLGYQVTSRGNHIDIYDPFAALSRNSFKVVYAMSGNSGSVSAQPGQVLSFKGTVGAVTPEASRTPDTLHALVGSHVVTLNRDDSTGYGKKVTSFFSDEIAENAASTTMANAVLKGRSRKKLPITAYAELVGDPSIVPGMIVDLQKYESGLDGYWIVTAANHQMTRGSSLTYLSLSRDSTADEDPAQNYSASPSPVPSSSTIKNRQWMSTDPFAHIY